MTERLRRSERRDVDTGSDRYRGDYDGDYAIGREEPTVAYIKRVLHARPQPVGSAAVASFENSDGLAPEQLLPPLTSSNAIDIQSYAFIAVILGNFVQIWYNRITPDQHFVGEIVQIIAHCTRGLEQRLRHVDLEALLLDELPKTLTEHVEVIRMAQRQHARVEPMPLEQRIRYHALHPHLALSPVPVDTETSRLQQENETAWCVLLVNRVLPLLLPPEDLQNPCLEVLVSEIFSEMIFRGGICGKASEPWLLWDGIAKILRSLKVDSGKPVTSVASNSQLEELGLLATTTKEQSAHDHSRRRFETLTQASWLLAQSIMTGCSMTRAAIVAVMQAASIPARPSRTSYTTSMDELHLPANVKSKRAETPTDDMRKQPIVSMSIWGCMSELLLLKQRMPWLSGILSLLQWMTLCGPGQLCDTNSRLDRLMSFNIHQKLLSANWLPSVLQAARNALFPDNGLAPPRIPPSDDEVAQIRHECATAILETIPGLVRTRVFATTDEDHMLEEIDAELDLLADAHINKHLIMSVIELLVVRLFPELAEGSPAGRQNTR